MYYRIDLGRFALHFQRNSRMHFVCAAPFRCFQRHFIPNNSTARPTISLHRFCSSVDVKNAISEISNLATPQSISSATPLPSSVVHSSRTIIEQNVKGTVKWFSARKNYGYIKLTDRDEEVFVHAGDIAKKNPLHSERSLQPGEEVEFCLEDIPEKGRRAVNVTGPGGTHVKGVYAPAVWYPTLRIGASPAREVGQITARNVQGTVKSYHLTNGWGFITRADTGTDVFVRARGIMGCNPQHRIKSLEPGEKVQFHVAEDSTGRQKAIAVTGPNGGPVQGNFGADGPLAVRILRGEFRKRPIQLRSTQNSDMNYLDFQRL